MEDNTWNNFYEKQAQGEVPYNSQFYLIDDIKPEVKDNPVQFVTPTAQQVEQAKTKMKKRVFTRPRKMTKKRKQNVGKKMRRTRKVMKRIKKKRTAKKGYKRARR